MSQSTLRLTIAAGAIVLIGVLAAYARSRSTVSRTDPPPAVYICRETKEIFFGTIPPNEVVHPTTNRATLLPAIFCPKCDAWQAAPPAERRYANAQGILCPKCQTPRSFTGEIPSHATEL